MITNNKGKFTRSISHIEVELGAKCGLFQTVEDSIPSYGKNKQEEVSPASIAGQKLIDTGTKELIKATELLEQIEQLSSQLSSSGADGLILEDDAWTALKTQFPGALQTRVFNASILKTLADIATKRLDNANTTIEIGTELLSSSYSTEQSCKAQKEQATAVENQAKAQKYAADKQKEAAVAQAEATLAQAAATVDAAEVQAAAQRYAADKQYDATVKAAEIAALTEDQKTLTANEIKAATILAKYVEKDPRFLTHPQMLIDALNEARANGEVINDMLFPFVMDRSDAKELERALKGDDKLKRADGKVDMETIVALTAVIIENKKPLAEVGIGLGGAILVGKLMDGDNRLFSPGMSPIEEQILDKFLQR